MGHCHWCGVFHSFAPSSRGVPHGLPVSPPYSPPLSAVGSDRTMTTLVPAVTVCVAAAFAVLALAAAAGDKAQAVGNPSPPPPGPPGWSAFCSSSLSEQRTEVPLVVNGSVPGWLRGSFLKNAAGRYEVGPRSLGNLQDGFAKVYRFRFEGGHVFFNTKFLRTAWYEASLAAGTVAPMMV